MARGRVGPEPGAGPIEARAKVRRFLSLASLERTRALLRTPRARIAVVAVAVAYVLVSMILGQLLTFPGFSGPSLVSVQWTGDPWYDFPELFVFSSGITLDLLFLPTITMVLVSAAVGIAAVTALFTAFPRLRGRPEADAREVAATSAAGASAAVTGLATMACCCTTCASAAGVAVVAATSGTSILFLLSQTWYLNLFQLVVVGLALLVQERALRLPSTSCPAPPRLDRAFVLGALLRIGLLVAGITWSLAMFVEWAEVPLGAADAALWYHWIVEHQLLAVAAVAAGMFPKEMASWIRNAYGRAEGWILRGLLVLGGVTWGIGVPPPVSGWGLGGLANEVAGLVGIASAWGAVAPDIGLGPVLVFHWGFQHLLLGGFAIALACIPGRALAPLIRTVDGTDPTPAPVAAERAGP